MSTKVRKQIYIESQQENLLNRLASETGISVAEIIRQAIDRHIRSLPCADHWTGWDQMRVPTAHCAAKSRRIAAAWPQSSTRQPSQQSPVRESRDRPCDYPAKRTYTHFRA